MRRSRRLRQAFLPRFWIDTAVETAWRVRQAPVETLEPTWQLDPEWLASLTLRWPSNYDWPLARTWLSPLLSGLRHHAKVEFAHIPQRYKRILVMQVVLGAKEYCVAVDYSDSMRINDECAERCAVYFKMQYALDGYASANVVPGGYIGRDIYPYLDRLRRLRDTTPPLFEVYGRFSVNDAKPVRKQALQTLLEQRVFRYEGGDKLVRFSRSVREAARAKICLDLPGRGDFCFRLVDYLSIGCCIVGPPHQTRLHVPLTDGEHIAYTAADLSDLVEVCAAHLNDADLRDRIARNARDFFDRYLHRDQLAGYYLHTLTERLAVPNAV